MSTEEILADYEDLERDDVRAALAFAARLNQVKRIERLAARGFWWTRQLPRRRADLLRQAGHDAVHTLDLPNANRTTDEPILDIAAREQRASRSPTRYGGGRRRR